MTGPTRQRSLSPRPTIYVPKPRRKRCGSLPGRCCPRSIRHWHAQPRAIHLPKEQSKMAVATPQLIVHVVYRFGVGGLENGVVNLINRMPAHRWQHAIVALTEVSAEFAARVERSDVRYIALNKRPGHLVRYYPYLYRLFKELRPAVVHTRNLAALEALVPAWAAGVPVRLHGEHGWDMNDPAGNRRRYRYVRRLYRPFATGY